MEITTGFIFVIIGAVGMTGCIIALAVSGKVFKKQREKLLRQIESE